MRRTPLWGAVQLDRLHAVPAPQGRPVQLAGVAQSNRDSVHAIASRLPLVLVLIAAITLILVFLLTGLLGWQSGRSASSSVSDPSDESYQYTLLYARVVATIL